MKVYVSENIGYAYPLCCTHFSVPFRNFFFTVKAKLALEFTKMGKNFSNIWDFGPIYPTKLLFIATKSSYKWFGRYNLSINIISNENIHIWTFFYVKIGKE